jgi:methyl-accepting chemotaxis protein
VSSGDEVSRHFKAIASRVEKAGVAMSESAAAAQQQTQGISQINAAVEQMNSLTQATAASAEESAATGEELSSQAATLRQLVESFRLDAGAVKSARPARRAVQEREEVVL